MDVYRGVIIYDNYTNITYGKSLPKQEKKLFTKYERQAWPDPKEMVSKIEVYEQSPKPNVLNRTSVVGRTDFEEPGEMPLKSPLLGETSKKRPISATCASLLSMKKDIIEKTNTMNMTLEELYTCLEKKKAQNLQLLRFTQNQFNFTQSVQYEPEATMVKPSCNSSKRLYEPLPVRDSKAYLKKGNVLSIWNNIKNKSENAFSLRHKGEQAQKELAQFNTDIKKLKEKQQYLETIITNEKKKRGTLAEDNLNAHVELRRLQMELTRKSRKFIKQDNQTIAMRGRYRTAQFMEYDINDKAASNLDSVKEAEEIRKKALGIMTKANIV